MVAELHCQQGNWGICIHFAVSVEVMCALKCLPNTIVSFPHQSGIVGRGLVWSVWENRLSHNIKTVSSSVQIYFWLPAFSYPFLWHIQPDTKHHHPEIICQGHLFNQVWGTEGELLKEADFFLSVVTHCGGLTLASCKLQFLQKISTCCTSPQQGHGGLSASASWVPPPLLFWPECLWGCLSLLTACALFSALS